MGKLPSYRICPTPPFQKVSVDLVGHYLVKPTMTSIKQSCFALRNTPEQISSDPGKGFVGSKNRIDKELGQIAQDLVNY